MHDRDGIFISLEGPDGSGKTTQVALLEQRLSEDGVEVVSTREPGGTVISNAIRSILLDPCYKEMTVLTEVFLYTAARAQLFEQVIEPALHRGLFVISDRFIDSSLAYQSFAGGVDLKFVLNVNLAAVKGRLPDCTFILDVAPEAGFDRRSGCGDDRIEQKSISYHRQVRAGFLKLAEHYPQRIKVIDASMSAEAVFENIWREVNVLRENF